MMKFNIVLVLTLITIASFGQINDFKYQRSIEGVSDVWHSILLPDDIYGKVQPNLNDIRVIGITEKNDTIEAPYILSIKEDVLSRIEVPFKLLNVSNKSNTHYFTLEISSKDSINQIGLEFEQQNFDWRVNIEGSQEQTDWYNIDQNQRIVSIQNGMIDFQYTTLTFPLSKYRYFRLSFASNEKPSLRKASVTNLKTIKGSFRTYSSVKSDIILNQKEKQTEILVDLMKPTLVSAVTINIKKEFDYYRMLDIQYVSDSVQTASGQKYIYTNLYSGIISSIKDIDMWTKNIITRHLKIIISNQDNQPLTIEDISVKGCKHELIVRLTDNASYFIVYGKSKVSKPNYDIGHFTDKIPTVLKRLELGSEVYKNSTVQEPKEPLFKSRYWLWSVMIMIIIVLGWFSFRMIKEK